MQPRDPNTLPAGLEHMRRLAVDLGAVGDRVTSAERQLTQKVGVPATGTTDGSVLTADSTQPGLVAWKANPMPIGAIIDYYGATEPTGWLFANGQAIPGTFTAAIALIGANTPDLRGRVTVALDNMGGVDAGRLSVANTLGAAAGVELVTLTSAQSGIPAHSHTIPKEDGQPVRNAAGTGGGFIPGYVNASFTGFGGSGTGTSAAADAASAHSIMQPYMLVNKLIRVV